jgi:hypothetical protein
MECRAPARALQTSSSYSTVGGYNGQIIIGGRFEF